ncbi:MAG: CpaF family protein [Ruminococcaceae bacterium]|nr:CpaF family protein [Oscillospiraceae bacterium]
MPVVQSYDWMLEKLKQYNLDDLSEPMGKETKSGQERITTADPADLQDLVTTICSQILQSDATTVAGVATRQIPRQVLLDLIARTAEQVSVRAGFFRKNLQKQVMDFLFGYGPLQPYISDQDISDIDGVSPDSFTIKKAGKRMALDLKFPSGQSYDAFCRLLIIRNGGTINENDSHCRVTDEQNRLRINVTVPPRSVRFPSLSIRKHRLRSLKLDDLIERRMLDRRTADRLRQWAQSDRTVLFCGKGAAGKTTLLRAFIEEMPLFERVLIAESDGELYPEKPCCLLQRIKKDHQGGRPVSLQDLVRDGLTMSLDTYCVGELVSDEAMALLGAAFSGHRCLATIHADAAEDVPDRILTLARGASRGESDRTLRRMIGRCMDLVICLRDFRVSQIVQIRGYQEESDQYVLETLWPDEENPATDAPVG